VALTLALVPTDTGLLSDDEVFAFDDGGTFGWHNGAFRSTGTTTPDSTPTGCKSLQWPAQARGGALIPLVCLTDSTSCRTDGGKCFDPNAGNGTYSACGTGGGTCDTMVRSYAWYFVWPNSSTATFA
jgi:hypothetical protein